MFGIDGIVPDVSEDMFRILFGNRLLHRIQRSDDHSQHPACVEVYASGTIAISAHPDFRTDPLIFLTSEFTMVLGFVSRQRIGARSFFPCSRSALRMALEIISGDGDMPLDLLYLPPVACWSCSVMNEAGPFLMFVP